MSTRLNPKIAQFVWVLFFLTGCAPSSHYAVVETLTPTPTNIPNATFSPRCEGTQETRILPTATPQPTLDMGPILASTSVITPVLSMDPPVGIVYRTLSGLWIVTEKGTTRVPVSRTSGEYTAKVCSSGESILVNKSVDPNHEFLVQNLTSGKTVDITSSPDQYFCSIDWLGNYCDTLLAYPMLISDPRDGCWSFPMLIDMNGTTTVIGTSSYSPYYEAAISPNGEYIAYNDRGHPVLYKIGDGSIPLNFDPEVFPGCDYSFSFPTWSSDGNKVAWEVTGWNNFSRVEGIGIYDLPGNKFTFLNSFALVDMGSSNISWNPNHDYLVVRGRTEGYPLSIIRPDGSTVFYLDRAVTSAWSPDGNWLSYGVYTSKGTIQYVISSDGHELHELSPGYVYGWSPDSRSLVYKDHDGYVIVRTGEWVPYRLSLPEGAKIMDWVNPGP